MSNIFDEIAEEAKDVESVATDAQMTMLRDKCRELVEAERDVDRLEAELKEAKDKKNNLAHKELPDIFNELGTDHYGMPDAGDHGLDLELKPYFKASIPADWPEDQKTTAFGHLEEIGGADIIKTEVKFTLGRDQLDLARTIVACVRQLGEAMALEGVGDIPQPSISMGVPWNTLTSFVKERHTYESSEEFAELTMHGNEDSNGPAQIPTMDLAVLNATVGQVVKIKERKA